MNKITKNTKPPAWDLSDLYPAIEDPQIEKDKNEIFSLVDKFISNYKNKINSGEVTPEIMLNALNELSTISEMVHKYAGFFGLIHLTDTKSEAIGKKYQEAKEFSNNVSTKLLWFDLEWLHLDDKKAEEIINDQSLRNYVHFLKNQRKFKPFVLKESEEKIISQLSQTGGSAFVRLYDEFGAQLKITIYINGKPKQLSFSQLGPYLNYHKSREIRKKTSSALSETLEENSKIYAYILNTLLLESKISDEIRGYKYPQEETFLSYELKKETVENMTQAIQNGYYICENFYEAKKKILRYRTLYEWDRYSPIYEQKSTDYTWDEAKNLVLDAFLEFDEKFYEIGKMFFDKKWIDAKIVDGKEHGALCSLGTPEKHPYVFMNFTGKENDVKTLAHELGHGIHSWLSKTQPLHEFYPSTATAEIASVFAEMLVFDKLCAQEKDKKKQINLLAGKLQDMFATVFRQNAFYLFETDIHSHRRKNGELGIEEFNNYYQNRLQEMFGKGLTLSKGHKYWWMPVLHFYHYDFYVFAYCMGELLTTALFAHYKNDKNGFKKGYFEALSLGGSKNPYEVTKVMGVDINKKDFWKNGVDIIKSYVAEFENRIK